jgi:hypothetical protein
VRGACDTTVVSNGKPHWVLASPTNAQDSVVEAVTVNLINGKMSGIEKEKFMFILHAICMQMTHLSLPILLSKHPCTI